MFVVSMERAWKDDSNHKYSKLQKGLQGFRNKATMYCLQMLLWKSWVVNVQMIGCLIGGFFKQISEMNLYKKQDLKTGVHW